MKISKIAKILPITLALSLSLCGAYAEDSFAADLGSKSAEVQYTLTLKDFVKITKDAGVISALSSYHTDYGSIRMSRALQTTFTVVSNAEQRKIKLAGTCPGGANAIKYVSPTTFELIFGNSDHEPDATSVGNILGGVDITTDADSNPNAISFLVTLTPTREHGPNVSGDGAAAIKATEWDTDHIAYTIQNGHTTLAYVVATDNQPNTFNTQDMSGTYTATLTMTDGGEL